jgi:putative addiction module component (TIGR02574 family)
MKEGSVDTTLEELQAAVLSLPEAERAQLAAKILASLDTDPEIEAAWRAEVRDRVAAYKRGEIPVFRRRRSREGTQDRRALKVRFLRRPG